MRDEQIAEAVAVVIYSRLWPQFTGCTFFDYDRDGKLDLAITNYLEFDRAKVPEAGSSTFCLWKGLPVMCGPRGLPFAQNYLFHNDGGGRFSDVSLSSGISKTKGCYGFTVVAADLDNDRRRACCITTKRMARFARWAWCRVSSGPALKELWSSRGSAVGDLDNDGSLEIVIGNIGERPSLLKNFAPRKNWLLVQCVGRSDIDAIGARVRAQVGGRWLHAEVLGGSSYLSQSDSRLHFGLGDSEAYDAVEVRWPGGERERFPGGAANRSVVLKQGAGQ